MTPFLLEFGNMLHISYDPEIADVLIALADVTKPQENTNYVKVYLEKILDLIFKTLNCVTTYSVILVGQEFMLPYQSVDQNIIAEYVKSLSRPEPVEFNS